MNSQRLTLRPFPEHGFVGEYPIFEEHNFPVIHVLPGRWWYFQRQQGGRRIQIEPWTFPPVDFGVPIDLKYRSDGLCLVNRQLWQVVDKQLFQGQTYRFQKLDPRQADGLIITCAAACDMAKQTASIAFVVRDCQGVHLNSQCRDVNAADIDWRIEEEEIVLRLQLRAILAAVHWIYMLNPTFPFKRVDVRTDNIEAVRIIKNRSADENSPLVKERLGAEIKRVLDRVADENGSLPWTVSHVVKETNLLADYFCSLADGEEFVSYSADNIDTLQSEQRFTVDLLLLYDMLGREMVRYSQDSYC